MRGRAAAIAVPAATMLFLAAALASVVLWARNIGMAEDWTMVPAMTGHQPDLAGWLWSQNNEHRLPLQRLIYLLLLKTTGDFRSGMVFSQLLLAGLALLLVSTAARLRGGRVAWSDLLFPAALLHLGHWENLVWGWQLQFVWSAALSGGLLALVVRQKDPLGRGGTCCAVLLFLLLPISGANGMILALSLLPWLAAQALVRLRDAGEEERRLGMALLAGLLLCLAVVLLYFAGYRRPSWVPPPPGIEQFLRTGALYLAYALGPATRWLRLPSFLLVATFMAGGGLLALRALLAGAPEERLRALGLTLFLCGGALLGAAIAWGRGALPHSIADRYALLSAMTLLAAALAWQLYGPPRPARYLLTGLALLYLLILPFNIATGFEWRDWYVTGMEKVEGDISAGLPPGQLAERNAQFLSWGKEFLAEAIEMLRQAGTGPFAALPEDG